MKERSLQGFNERVTALGLFLQRPFTSSECKVTEGVCEIRRHSSTFQSKKNLVVIGPVWARLLPAWPFFFPFAKRD
jgi:hypothetical protein